MKSNIKVINNVEKEIAITIKGDADQMEIFIDAAKGEKKLEDLSPGDIFSINDVEYIVCEQFNNGTTAVVRKDCLDTTMEFGENNNWEHSKCREYLNTTYIEELEKYVGSDNIIPHEVNLLSLDGYDDYGIVSDKIAVMTIDEYRRYHKYIGDTSTPYWLSTPDSTPSGFGGSCVRYVRGDGDVDCGGCDWDWGGRPFFILKSLIFVS